MYDIDLSLDETKVCLSLFLTECKRKIGITMPELAEKMRYSEKQLQRILSNKGIPQTINEDFYLNILDALGATHEEFKKFFAQYSEKKSPLHACPLPEQSNAKESETKSTDHSEIASPSSNIGLQINLGQNSQFINSPVGTQGNICYVNSKDK